MTTVSWIAFEPCEVRLRDVQGSAIAVYGRRRVLLVLACLEDNPEEVIADFVIADVERAWLSLVKMVRAGANFQMRDGCLRLQFGDKIDSRH